MYTLPIIIFVISFFYALPFIINDSLAESRGKSRVLIFILTLIFSFIVTLILAFVPKQKEVKITTFSKVIAVISFVVIAFVSFGGIVAFQALKPEPSTVNETRTSSKQNEIMEQGIPHNELKITQNSEIGPMVKIEEFIVNIISEEGRHYVKAAITLELDKDDTLEEVNTKMPSIRDSILVVVGHKTYDELQDLQEKRKLKADLVSKINSFLHTGSVTALYFTDFTVQ